MYYQTSSTSIFDVTLENIEALAQLEGGDNDGCAESLVSSTTEYLGGGGYRMKGEYRCGNGMGGCKTGTVYIYYTSGGSVIGTDDQRMSVSCS